MSLLTRVKSSAILTEREKSILLLLEQSRALSVEEILSYLGGGYNTDQGREIINGLAQLNKKGLLRIDTIKLDRVSYRGEAYLTFAMDWVNKI